MHDFRFCLCNKTANRGQCVTKYRAAVRPAFIGGEETGWGEQVGRMERGGLLLEGLLWNRKWQMSLRSLTLLIEYVKVMSVMCCVNYLPYHKVHLWRTAINMHQYECFQNWTSPLSFSPPTPFLPSTLPLFFFLLGANKTIKTTSLKCNPPVDVLKTFPIPSLLVSLFLAALSPTVSLSSSLPVNLLIVLWCGMICKMFSSHKVIRKFHELVQLYL